MTAETTTPSATAIDAALAVAAGSRGEEEQRLAVAVLRLAGEHTVSECVARIGLSQGRVSAHLACLAGCGYVQSRMQGRFAWYRAAGPRVAGLVMLARSLAAGNAAALAECVRIAGVPAGRDGG